MVVTKTQYGPWVALSGTLAEVVQALRDEGISTIQCKNVFHDGTNYVAVYRKGV